MFDSCPTQPLIEFIPTRNGEVRVRGYLAIWGSLNQRDCYDTWFDRQRPPELGLDLLPVALFYEHNGDGSVRRTRIGKVVAAEFDDVGIAYTAVVDMTTPIAPQAIQEIRKHELATSSGSSSHLARFDDEGRFVDWMLAEVSLTRYPCEHRMPMVEMVRRDDKLVLVDTAPSRDTAMYEAAVDLTSRTDNNATDAPQCACGVHENLDDEKRGLRMLTLEELGFAGDVTTAQIIEALITNYGRDQVSAVYTAVFAVEGAPLDDFDALLGTALNEFPEIQEEELVLLVQVLFAAFSERDDAETVVVDALGAVEDEPAEDMPEEEPERGELETETVEEDAVDDTEPVAEETTRREPNPELVAELQTTVQALRSQVEDLATRSDHLTPPLPQIQEDVPMIQVTDRKYDRHSAYELAAGLEIMRCAARAGRGAMPSEQYLNALTEKAKREVKNDSAVRSRFANSGLSQSDIRADELVSITNNATWAGDYYSGELWQKIRTRPVYEVLVAAGMVVEEVPEGTNSFKQLAEGADVEVYHAPESEDATSSTGIPAATLPIGSTNFALKTIGLSKVSGRLMVSGETYEDVILSNVGILTSNLEDSLGKGIEGVLLFGDTTVAGTGNINSDDQALAATSKFTAMDGIAHLPLVTATGMTYSAGALTASDYKAVRKLMGVNAINPTGVVYIVDTDTYFETLDFTEVKTMEVFGQGATIYTGHLDSIWGSPLLASDQMFLAEADGKINTLSPSGTLLGRILAISAPRWKFGWKRRLTPEFQRWAGADVNEIVMHARFGLAYADEQAASLAYNITV